MASQGPLSPSVAANDSSAGTMAWSVPNNSKVSDNAHSRSTVDGGSGDSTQYLKVTGFGFSIPSDATINGIKVQAEGLIELPNGESGTSLYSPRIVKGGSIGSTDPSVKQTFGGSEAYKTYGSETELWGQSWSPSDINASDFGFALRISISSGIIAYGVAVDHIRITVYYTTAGPANVKTKNGLAQASVKTIEGLAIASIKTVNNLS